MEWEVQLIEWLQDNLGAFGTGIWQVLSFIGGEKGLLIAVLILLFCWKKEAGKRLVLIVIAVNVWLPMIKAVVKRPRPYSQYPDRVKALSLVDPGSSAQDVAAQGYSFPSMHSASVVALYFSLAHEARKRWLFVLAGALALLVGISRMATGNHYPTDVLTGWVLGFVAIWIFAMLEKYVEREWVRHVILLVTAMPGLFFVRTEDYFTSLGVLIGVIIAFRFEQRFVNFRDTRNVWAMIIRPIGAFAIYFVMNTLLKMPFGEEFLDSGTLAALLVRTGRYAVVMFLIMGVYPKVFPVFDRIGKKKAGEKI